MRYTVFDIETRIEKSLVRAVYFPHQAPDAMSDDEAYDQVRAQLKEEQGNDFFPLSFHVPVSIAVGQVNDARILTSVETLGQSDASEEALVRDFWTRVERFHGTLVSFNGRNFDLPVLELHALKYGCQLPRYFGGRHRYRFSDEGHYDLYDFVTNYGVQRLRGGFNLLARLIGLPGKRGIDGSMVQGLWQEGRLPEVHRYCRDDVIQTYFLFLRIELIRGRLSTAEYDRALGETAEFRRQLEQGG